jgi:L-iditol 2-dehydrogenase
MKAMRLYGKHDLRMEDLPIPICGPGQVLIRTLFCGVCGSDPPRVLDGLIGISPAALGHEFSAEVVEAGEGVTSVKPGDLVCCVPLVVCNTCPNCLDGNYGQCVKSRFIGASYPDIGGFHEFNVLPEQNVLKLPAGIDPLAAAFTEPASVALHSLLLIGYQPHQDLAIVGMGGIGQLVLQGARAMGAGRIFAFDIVDERLETAMKMGATACFNTGEAGFIDKYHCWTSNLGSPQVIEAVGYEVTIKTAISLAKVNGRIGLIGTMHAPVTLPPELFYGVFSKRQLWLRGVWMSYSKGYPGAPWRLAAQYLADGRINIEPLLFEVSTIEDAYKAIAQFSEPENVKGKIVIKM